MKGGNPPLEKLGIHKRKMYLILKEENEKFKYKNI
jgi:hypothetical protein